MTYRVYFKHKDGTRDNILISGNTIEELKKIAKTELEKRNATGLFSEKVEL